MPTTKELSGVQAVDSEWGAVEATTNEPTLPEVTTLPLPSMARTSTVLPMGMPVKPQAMVQGMARRHAVGGASIRVRGVQRVSLSVALAPPASVAVKSMTRGPPAVKPDTCVLAADAVAKLAAGPEARAQL